MWLIFAPTPYLIVANVLDDKVNELFNAERSKPSENLFCVSAYIGRVYIDIVYLLKSFSHIQGLKMFSVLTNNKLLLKDEDPSSRLTCIRHQFSSSITIA